MDQQKHNLKKFILIISLWLLLAVSALFGGTYLYRNHQAEQYAATAVPYVKQVLPTIASWNPEAIRALMAAESLATIPPERFDKAIELFAKLGGFKGMDEPRFDEKIEITVKGSGNKTLLNYKVATRHTQGKADFILQLIDRGDHVQLYNFSLSSAALM